MNFEEILADQRTFFNSLKTRPLQFRKRNLEKLREVIRKNEDFLYEAVYKDFSKSKCDSQRCNFGNLR